MLDETDLRRPSWPADARAGLLPWQLWLLQQLQQSEPAQHGHAHKYALTSSPCILPASPTLLPNPRSCCLCPRSMPHQKINAEHQSCETIAMAVHVGTPYMSAPVRRGAVADARLGLA